MTKTRMKTKMMLRTMIRRVSLTTMTKTWMKTKMMLRMMTSTPKKLYLQRRRPKTTSVHACVRAWYVSTPAALHEWKIPSSKGPQVRGHKFCG